MSQMITLRCDVCGGTDAGVQTMVVSRPGSRSWEADLCDACYEAALGKLRAKSRPAQKAAGRPQVRKRVTRLDAP